LADINDLLDANPDWKNSVVKPAIDEFTVNGKTYSVGNGVSLTSLIFYNKDLFERNNVTYPKTFSEFKQACRTFLDNGVIPIAHGDKTQWPAQSSILSCVANRETGSEWLNNVLSGSGAKFTDPEFIKALNNIKELADMGAFNKDYMSLDNAQMRDYFFRGEAAMMIDGSWALPEIFAKAPDDLRANIQVGVFPAFEGGKGDPDAVSGVSATGIVISAKASAEQKAAIEKLIMKLTDADAQDLYVRNGVIPSAVKTNIPESELDPILKQVLDVLGNNPLVAVYDSALNSEQTEIINNGLQSLMLGSKTAEQVAQELQSAVKP
jgi:raffinose/stachyose/melibiose transport system substrate-binding protein